MRSTTSTGGVRVVLLHAYLKADRNFLVYAECCNTSCGKMYVCSLATLADDMEVDSPSCSFGRFSKSIKVETQCAYFMTPSQMVVVLIYWCISLRLRRQARAAIHHAITYAARSGYAQVEQAGCGERAR